MSRTPLRAPLGAAACLLLLGCAAVGPDYAAPPVALPERYVAPSNGGASTDAMPMAWWQAFRDPTLSQLVEQALAQSPTLREATARVREARALRGVVGGAQLPELSANGRYERSRRSEELSGAASRFSAREEDLFDAGFDASYEVDLFGRVRRSVEAADADLAAAEASGASARLSLAAEVARRYVELRSAQRRHALARRHLVAQEDGLALVRARAAAGIDSELPASQAESALAATGATLPRLAREADLARHQLATLLAVPAASLPVGLAEPADEQALAAALPSAPSFESGVPAELIARRPDLRRAERELAAATARVGVATADLYPRLTLNGGLGLQSTHFAALGDVGSAAWSIGPDLHVPLFNHGRLRAALAAEDARAEQALARFEQSVIAALVEVEDALAAAWRERERGAALAIARAADQRTLDLSRELWTRGLTDYLAVTTAEQQLLDSEQETASAAAGELLATIALCKAVGGGFEPDARAR